MKQLATALDECANAPVFIGSGPDLLKRIAKVRELADGFKHSHLDPIELSPDSTPHTVAEISQALRSLSVLVERSDRMLEQGRAEELQAQASRIGHVLLRASYYENLDSVEARTILRDAGRELHLVETMRMYLDGGVSENALKQTLASNLTTLKEVTRYLSNSTH